MTLLSNVKKRVEDEPNFCGHLRISKLYQTPAIYKKCTYSITLIANWSEERKSSLLFRYHIYLPKYFLVSHILNQSDFWMPPCSTRSSVSSMNSMSSMSSTSLPQQYNPNNNLNHALAVVTNQLEREQRKHDQEATRKLTLLRQRKISAVLKVNNFWE